MGVQCSRTGVCQMHSFCDTIGRGTERRNRVYTTGSDLFLTVSGKTDKGC